MIGIYFSGTGNTRYCLEKFVAAYDNSAERIALETPGIMKHIKENQDIILAYPIYYSNLPKIVDDFIKKNCMLWKGKKIYIIATMGLFSGDGAGLAARLLRKYGAKIVGGLHLKMPDCICDVKALKRSEQENRDIVAATNNKILIAAEQLKHDHPTQEGLNFFNHVAGLLGQRLWFYGKTRNYTDELHINVESCIGCGNCACVCPMDNISISDHKAISSGQCTMCYRCINLCPKKAITLIGKRVIAQHTIKDYL